MNWKDSLIAIYVPLEGNDEGKVATAVPIGNGLILTARHVVVLENRGSEPIELHHWYLKGDDRITLCGPDDEAIVWECERLDIALLRPPKLPDTPLCYLHPRRLSDGDGFSGEAFPQAGVRDGVREPEAYLGEVATKAAGEPYFELQLNDAKRPASAKAWKGASGMPVVMDEMVVGVCIEVDGHWPSNGVLRATAIEKLWEEGQFRDLVRPQVAVNSFRSILRTKVKLLQEDGATLESFNDSVAQFGDECVPLLTTEEARVDPFVERLLSAPSKTLLDILYHTKMGLLEAGELGNGLKLVEDIARIVAPVVIGLHGTRASSVRDAVRNGSGAFSLQPIGTRTLAELVMAAAEERPASYRARQVENELPAGKAWIPIPVPNARSAASPDELAHQMIEEIARACGVTVDRDLIIENLKASMTVSRELKRALPYFAFAPRKNKDERELDERACKIVQRSLPLLNVLVLNEELEPKERTELHALPYLMPLARDADQ